MFSPIGTLVLCAAASNKLLINKSAFAHVIKTAARHFDVERIQFVQLWIDFLLRGF